MTVRCRHALHASECERSFRQSGMGGRGNDMASCCPFPRSLSIVPPMNPVPQFNVPPAILVGAGASRQLAAQSARLGARGVLLVTDSTMVATGMADRCVAELTHTGLTTTIFAGIQPDPT